MTCDKSEYRRRFHYTLYSVNSETLISHKVKHAAEQDQHGAIAEVVAWAVELGLHPDSPDTALRTLPNPHYPTASGESSRTN